MNSWSWRDGRKGGSLVRDGWRKWAAEETGKEKGHTRYEKAKKIEKRRRWRPKG